MKTLLKLGALGLLLLTTSAQLSIAHAQGTAFTYQGRLNDGANPANGVYDVKFELYSALNLPVFSTPPITNTLSVTNGLFTTTLDFGDKFNGADRLLEISIRTNGAVSFTTLTPRQTLSPTPYAIYASNAAVAASVPAGSITAAMFAPGAVNQLGSPDGSPTNALVVNTNGWLGLGTNVPVAGLTIASGPTVLAPLILSETVDGTGAFTNLSGAVSVAAYGANLLAIAATTENAVTLVNNSDPTAPVVYTNLVNGIAPYTNLTGASAVAFRTNGLLAIAAGTANAVTLVDAANGSAPVWRSVLRNGVGGFNDLASVRSVAFSGNLLAIASLTSNAVTLVDVSNPASPILRSVLKDGVGVFTNLAGACSVAFSGNLLAIGASTDNAVTLVDVSNPASPVLRSSVRQGVGGYNFLQTPFGLLFQTNILAVADLVDGAVSLIDVSTPTAPVLRSVLSGSALGQEYATYTEGLAFNGSLLAIGSRVGALVSLVDVANPSAPVLRGVYRQNVAGAHYLSQPRSVAFAGNNLAVVDADFGALSLFAPTPQAVGLNVQPWVGIGTSLPVAPLTVFGNVVVRQANVFDIEATTIQLGFSRATANYSAAIGVSEALAEYAFAGGNSQARGIFSTALGASTANGSWDTALGDSTADGFAAFAAGNATARGAYAVALGQTTLATNNAMAAGTRAKAIHDGAFVWADDTGNDFVSTAANQFLIRAGGGVGVGVSNPAYVADFGGRVRFRNDANTAGIWFYNTNTATDRAFVGMAGDGNGLVGLWGNTAFNWGLVMNTTNLNIGIGNGQVNPTNKLQVVNAYCNGSSWVNASDRNLKQDFADVDAATVLEKIVALPIQSWAYKAQPGEKHIGPVAQDFHAAFGLGQNDTSITTVDESGVALAAIQGLNQKLEAKSQKLESENAELKQQLAELKALVQAIAKPH